MNEEEGLNEEDFVRICPALIQQLQDKACIVDNLEDNHMAEDSAKMLHGKIWYLELTKTLHWHLNENVKSILLEKKIDAKTEKDIKKDILPKRFPAKNW